MKIPHCQHCKSRDNLYKNSRRIDKNGKEKWSFMCRKCNSERVKKYRSTEKGRKNINKAVYRSTITFRYKQDAREILNKALKKGAIQKKKCTCGSNKVEAHHPDYFKPLEVIWLCRTHHADLHRRLKYV